MGPADVARWRVLQTHSTSADGKEHYGSFTWYDCVVCVKNLVQNVVNCSTSVF
jgi:hypothetical protein